MIMVVEWLRGVSFSFFEEPREVVGDAGGEEVVVSVEEPGGERVGGGNISSVVVGVIGDICWEASKLSNSRCSTRSLTSWRLEYAHSLQESRNVVK